MSDQEKKAFRGLVEAAGDLWRVERHRETYGRSYFVIGQTFEQARQKAITAVSNALEEAGRVLYADVIEALTKQETWRDRQPLL